MIILGNEKHTNPKRMKIHWKTMATCDKYYRYSKTIAEAKELHDKLKRTYSHMIEGSMNKC